MAGAGTAGKGAGTGPGMRTGRPRAGAGTWQVELGLEPDTADSYFGPHLLAGIAGRGPGFQSGIVGTSPSGSCAPPSGASCPTPLAHLVLCLQTLPTGGKEKTKRKIIITVSIQISKNIRLMTHDI